MIDKFSNEVIEQIGYYVYRLIDPRNGQTFYIGKGKGNRVFQHVKGAIERNDGDYETSDLDPNKLHIIKDILSEGLEVIHIIQRWHMTEHEALLVEAALIDTFSGLTNMQRGHHSEFGITNAESLEKRFKLTEYKEPDDFKYVIIKVRQWRLDELFDEYPETYRYEATRSAWRIKPKSIMDYPYAFSVTDGIVREIYKINNWYFTEDRQRYAFEGEIAPKEIRERFVNKRIPETYMKKGMASPILFSKNKKA